MVVPDEQVQNFSRLFLIHRNPKESRKHLTEEEKYLKNKMKRIDWFKKMTPERKEMYNEKVRSFNRKYLQRRR
jgi:hypothetical protein